MAFDKESSTPGGKKFCYQKELAMAVPNNLKRLEKFVNETWTDGPNNSGSNYSKAFRTAFQYFINSPSSHPRREFLHL